MTDEKRRVSAFSAVAVLAAFCTGILFLLAVPSRPRAEGTSGLADPSAVPLIGPPKGWDE